MSSMARSRGRAAAIGAGQPRPGRTRPRADQAPAPVLRMSRGLRAERRERWRPLQRVAVHRSTSAPIRRGASRCNAGGALRARARSASRSTPHDAWRARERRSSRSCSRGWTETARGAITGSFMALYQVNYRPDALHCADQAFTVASRAGRAEAPQMRSAFMTAPRAPARRPGENSERLEGPDASRQRRKLAARGKLPRTHAAHAVRKSSTLVAPLPVAFCILHSACGVPGACPLQKTRIRYIRQPHAAGAAGGCCPGASAAAAPGKVRHALGRRRGCQAHPGRERDRALQVAAGHDAGEIDSAVRGARPAHACATEGGTRLQPSRPATRARAGDQQAPTAGALRRRSARFVRGLEAGAVQVPHLEHRLGEPGRLLRVPEVRRDLVGLGARLALLSARVEEDSEPTPDHAFGVERWILRHLHARVVLHLRARLVAHLLRWPHDPGRTRWSRLPRPSPAPLKSVILPSGTSSPQHSTTRVAPYSMKTSAAFAQASR